MAETIYLCPVCGERLAVETKKTTAGDPVARRACAKTGDYTEPWQYSPPAAPATAGEEPVTLSHGFVTAGGSPRQAALIVVSKAV